MVSYFSLSSGIDQDSHSVLDPKFLVHARASADDIPGSFDNYLLELPKVAIDVDLVTVCERSESVSQFRQEFIDCRPVFKFLR